MGNGQPVMDKRQTTRTNTPQSLLLIPDPQRPYIPYHHPGFILLSRVHFFQAFYYVEGFLSGQLHLPFVVGYGGEVGQAQVFEKLFCSFL